MTNIDHIYFVYYKSGSGSTIMIKTGSKNHLLQIKKVVSELANGDISEFRISAWQNAKITGFCDMLMILDSKKQYNNTETQNINNGLIIKWSQTEAGWYSKEGLIDGLIENYDPQSGCHQYLSLDSDRILIELY